MRREAVHRVWTTVVAIAASASGLVLWQQGERLMGGLGLATSLLHLVWIVDLRRCTRACVRRRPIVIPRLRHRTDATAARHG